MVLLVADLVQLLNQFLWPLVRVSTLLLAGDADLGARYVAVFGALPDVTGWPGAARPVGEGSKDPMQAAWESMYRT